MTDRAEKVFREGLAELARSKPELGTITTDDLERSRARRPAADRAPVSRWLALAAAVVVVAGLGLGLFFGGVLGPGTTVLNAEPAAPTVPLIGTRWLTTQIQGEPASTGARGQLPSLIFDDDGSAVRANDTCNSISGRYHLDGDALILRDLATTTISCSVAEEPSRQPAAFAEALGEVARWELSGSTLTLFDGAGSPLLAFRAAEASSPTSATPATTVQVRIRNESQVAFDQVRVVFPRGPAADYGPLAAGASTAYRTARQAYPYAYIRVTVDGQTLTLQPRDYVGETPLEPGRYTYALTLDHGSLDLRFEVDR